VTRSRWIVDRLAGEADAVATPIGILPTRQSLDVTGLDIGEQDMDLLLSVDRPAWREEADLLPRFFAQFGDALPAAMIEEQASLVRRLTD